jgi:hypothetical protein
MYIRPKVVGPFAGPEPYARRSYMHRAALLYLFSFEENLQTAVLRINFKS